MARRQVSIFVNGKQVEGQLNSIYAAKRQITNELNRMVIGTEEYERAVNDLKKLNGVLDTHRQKIGTVEKGFGKLTSIAGGFAAGLVAQLSVDAIISFGTELFNLGTQMEVLQRKAQTVFAEALPQVTEQAEANANAMGLTAAQYTTAAAAIGDLLIPMGFQREEAAGISTELVNLSGALSEWTGGQIKAEEVTKILGKAVLGEREELKGLGISISEADVKARLAEKGLDKLTGQMLEQAKAAATLELITEKSVDAQNAYAQNSDTLVRKQAELRARFTEIKETMATALIPVFTRLLEAAMPVVEGIGEFVTEALKGEKATGKYAGAIKIFGTILGNLGKVFGVVVESGKGLVRWLLNNFGGAIIKMTEVNVGFYNTFVKLVNGFIDLTKIKVGKLEFLDPKAYTDQIIAMRDGLNKQAQEKPIEIPVETKIVGGASPTAPGGGTPPGGGGDSKAADKRKKEQEKEAKDLESHLKRLQEITAQAQQEADLAALTEDNRRLEQIRLKFDKEIMQAKELEDKGMQEATAARIELERLRDEAIQAELDKISEEALVKEQARQEKITAFKQEIKAVEDEAQLTEYELARQIAQQQFDLLIEQAQQYGLDVTGLQEALRIKLAAIDKEFNEKQLEESTKFQQQRLQVFQQSFSALGSAFSDLYTTLEKEEGNFLVLQKASTLAQIAVDTAAALSSLTASSEANPANAITGGLAGVAQYASGIIRLLANFAKAKQVLFGAPKLQQRKSGGWLGVLGADDNRMYQARYIGEQPTGMLPHHPVVVNTTQGPVLASEAGSEYFVNHRALQNPTVMNYVRAIDNISRTRQFRDGGFTSPLPDAAGSASATGAASFSEMVDINRRLLAVLEAGIYARVDDPFIADLRRRQQKLAAVSGGAIS